MAYMGRGGFSSFGGDGLSGGFSFNNNNKHDDNKHDKKIYYTSDFFRRYCYIQLDNTYFIVQMVTAIVIFTIIGITFLATYKPLVIDPIKDTKKILMNTYIIVIFTLLVVTILVNYFSKNKNALIRRLVIILALSTIVILVFFGIKVNMDSIYTKNKFEQIYEQEYSGQSSDTKSKVNIGLTEMKIKTEKEYYIDECVKAYNIFSIRMYGVIGINVLFIVLLIYQISKVSKIQEKKDRLSKDDAVLFDEEENIKI